MCREFSASLGQIVISNRFDVLNSEELEEGETKGVQNSSRKKDLSYTTKKVVGRQTKGSKLKSKLKCVYFNARSIVNKRAEIELLVHEENPDVIGITETWLRPDIEDSEINLDSYALFRKDRTNARGGGVLIYIRETLKALIREDLTQDKFEESIWIELRSMLDKTIIGVCYRAPTSNATNDDSLFKLISKCSKESVLVMGDFNFGDIKWEDYDGKGQGKLFLDCISDNIFSQHVDQATRKSNILDLILSNEDDIVQNLEVGEEFSTSDHQVIRFDLIISKDKVQASSKYFNFHRADYDHMRMMAKDIGLQDAVSGLDVINDWENVKAKILHLQEMCVPKMSRTNRRCKWVTRKTIKCRRAKKKAWEHYKKQNTPEAYENYKRKLNISTRENRKAQENFENKLSKNIKNDTKGFFSYVRNKQRSRVGVGPLKDADGNMVLDDLRGANLLNSYFSSVFTRENLANVPDASKLVDDKSDNNLIDIEITEELVKKKLDLIKVDKSTGVDEIHPRMLFELRDVLVKPLTTLFNASLATSLVPLDWKSATVVPLFKKGKRSDPQNYRPVSLTSITCKVLESILKEQMVEHLAKLRLIKDTQHGFTKGRSCLTNLLDFLEDATKWVDEGIPVDVIYLDFAKAFDKVPHTRLIKKLEAHGISGKVSLWISNWLSNRKQRVSLNSNLSGWSDVLSGVPQGSVLGPLLFLIFINDIDDELSCKIIKFADDTKICRNIINNNDAISLNQDLKKLAEWADKWQMQFNVDKCVVMHLGRNNSRHEYTLGETVLRTTDLEKDLGVMISSNCKVSEQCSKAVKKANSMLWLLNRKIKFKSKDNITRLYKALIRPHLEYCIQAWNPYEKKDVDLLEGVQRRALRMIYGYRDISYEERLKRTGLTTLVKRRERGDLIEVFKIVKEFDKVNCDRFFKQNNIGLRGHRYKLEKNRSRLDVRKHFFSQRVVNSWNKLPATVVEAESLNAFKNRLDVCVF